jgi:Holliday junction resolvase RusA-like endonuclease
MEYNNRRKRIIKDEQRKLAEANKRIAEKVGLREKSNKRNKKRCKKEDGPNSPSTIFIVIKISDRRRRDIDNMVSTIFDCMVKAKLVDDDNVQKIGSANTKVAFVPKGQEGFDIMIIDG